MNLRVNIKSPDLFDFDIEKKYNIQNILDNYEKYYNSIFSDKNIYVIEHVIKYLEKEINKDKDIKNFIDSVIDYIQNIENMNNDIDFYEDDINFYEDVIYDRLDILKGYIPEKTNYIYDLINSFENRLLEYYFFKVIKKNVYIDVVTLFSVMTIGIKKNVNLLTYIKEKYSYVERIINEKDQNGIPIISALLYYLSETTGINFTLDSNLN
jgi:hypothetical protein